MKKNKKRPLRYYAFTYLIATLACGTILFHMLEDWTYIQAFYFSVATISTVGYGDLTPTHDLSRLCVALYILFGTTGALAALTIIGSEYFKKYN